MKVLMLGKIGLLEGSGGDKVQVLNTSIELRKLGIEVDIKDSLNFDVKPYDLVHVFQLDWTPESNIYVKKAKEAGKPVVFSPIHHSINELITFENEYAFDFRRVSRLIFNDQFKRDTFKDFYRMLFDTRRVVPVMQSVTRGLKNMHIETLELSDMLLVQTELEVKDIESTFGVIKPWRKVPNGVGAPFFNTDKYENELDYRDYILCVGRIEPRKNQLSIIKAVKELRGKTKVDHRLLFIGKKSTYKHFEYTYMFDRELKHNDWIEHISRVPYESIPSYYHNAKVCVSASWFETTGLTSLEALFCGANAVASGSRAEEYLGDNAFYCIPNSVDSIATALERAYNADSPKLTEEFKAEYTWATAARKTLEVYNELLKS